MGSNENQSINQENPMLILAIMLTAAAIAIGAFLATVFGVKSIFRTIGNALKDVLDGLANVVRSFRRA